MALRRPATIPEQELERVASAYNLAMRLSQAGFEASDLTEIPPDDPSFWMCSSKQPTKHQPFSKEK
jgi:hypothetical protein